ncbi:MAG: PAS domain-containing protein [Cytophagales bacterium]|nr:PAS domain-containing protein [Rhizobacter sp.]
MNASLSPDESRRLQALQLYEVLDTQAEDTYDDITRLAAQLAQTPISLISLVDESRQWFKSHFGLGVSETPREYSFCAHAILERGEVFEVQDAWLDTRFADNPLVTAAPFMRFYAGTPLITPDGRALGTLNVIDRVPRKLTEAQATGLRVLGRQVVAQLELRRRARELKAEVGQRTRSEALLRQDYELVISRLRQSEQDKDRLLEQAEAARLSLINVLEDEKRTGRALLEAQRFAEQITEIMPSVLYVYDFNERRNVFVNREVVSSLGYTQGELEQGPVDPVVRFMHSDDQALFGAHMARVLALPDATVAEFTYRMRHADGRWRWFQSRDAVFARNPDGAVRQVVGTATDITAIKVAEESLRSSEERFRTLAELSPVGIGAANAAGAMSYVNQRAGEIIGLPVAQCLGEGWVAAVHPDDHERVESGLHDAVARGVTYRDEFRFVHAEGRVVHVIAEGRPLLDEHTKVMSYVATLVDVSALKEIEQHQRAREAAEQANKAKSDFLARMSHELRTPLNAILGFSQLMQMDSRAALSAPQAERVQHIRSAGEHLLEMINETLDLARIEGGRIALSVVPVRLAALAAVCATVVEPMALRADVQLHNQIAADANLVLQADPVRLQEILLNLLSNAIKYNRPGGHVHLEAHAQGDRVFVSVRDSGAGLNADQLANLFQPFNRLGAESTGIEGTGLGLAIAERLARLMGGALSASSQPGEGSVFTLELAAAPADGKSAPLPAPGEVRRAEVEGAFSVVYIEDDASNALLLEQVFATLPRCRLRVARCGANGVAEVLRDPPDLVLLDLNLPDISGFEVLARLRANPRTRALTCVALSADAMPDNIQRVRDAGFDDFLSKPIEIDGFVRRIADLLAPRTGANPTS